MGSFETRRRSCPTCRQAPVKVSSVDARHADCRPTTGRQRSDNPLIRDGVELLPSLTHVVDRDQKMYFYYEVYEPQAAAGGSAAAEDEPGVLSRLR